MSLAARLEKIETAADVAWPCWMCEIRRERDERCYSFLIAHGIEVRRPKERDVLTLPCVVCDEPIRYDFTGYSTDEREAERCINEEEILYRRQGRLPT
jgi:RNase P subunit RPR2